METYHTIVIGAGQAGLSMGYYLKQLDVPFLIIDKSQAIGEVWQSRYDSLVLFTPRQYSSLPGLKIQGEANGFPTKDEITSYLKAYTETFHLPIQLQTEVTHVLKKENCFYIETNKQAYKASNVVVATGPFQKPRIPDFARNLAPDILQLHSSQYQNPTNLRDGNVLIVGGGNSGAQIAVELATEKETYLSVSQKLRFLPLKIGNKSIFGWFDKMGILDASPQSWIGRKLRANGDPIFGFELKEAINKGKVILKDRAVHGKATTIQFQDTSVLDVQNIIWATGFVSDYNWLDVHGVLDDQGKPIHHRGVSKIPGLYFLGLPWQYRRGSALLQGVGHDAQYLAEQIGKNFKEVDL